MKLWRFNRQTGEYTLLPEWERQLYDKPKEIKQPKPTPLTVLRNELAATRNMCSNTFTFCLLAAWIIFGFCVAMIQLAAMAFVLLVFVPYQIIMTISRWLQ